MYFSMQDFLVHLIQKIWTIIICTLVCATITLIGTYLFTKPIYDVSFSLYIYNSNERETSSTISVSDLTASQELLNTYIAMLKSESLLQDVVDMLPTYNLSVEKLKSCVKASSVNKTELLKVTVSHEDPDAALDISQSLQILAPDFISKVVKVGSVEIVDNGVNAVLKDRPLLRNICIGGGLGCLGCIAVLLAVFVLDTRIWDETGLSSNYKLPIIGSIPIYHDGESYETLDFNDYILSKETPFQVTEAYRSARVFLQKLSKGRKCNVYAVTSACPGEGKTITAINIALSLAQNGSKVLLMDLDLRKPQIRNYLNLQNNSGFLSFLSGKQSYVDILSLEGIPLHILASSHAHSEPAELFATGPLSRLMTKLKDSFDYIIVDTPPLDSVIDAAVISDMIDGYLLCVRAGFTKTGLLSDTIRKLEQINANILGFYINNIDGRHAGIESRYHVYHYKTDYKSYSLSE